MTNQAAAIKDPKPGSQLISMMAKQAHLDANAFASTVKATCFDKDCSREQFLAFLMIAQEHGLNPITREIYAFAKGGKIMPIVSIDGWLKIINEHPQFNGMQFLDALDEDGKLISITCKIHRRDRDIPTEVTEYLDECKMPTEPWKKWPARMLRHKSTIQAARYAFGFSGIIDPDEAERLRNEKSIEGVASIVPEEAPQTAAKRITQKIKAKVEESDLQPSESVQAAPAARMENGYAADSDFTNALKDGGVADSGDENPAPSIDEIPGLKKGTEIEQPEMSDEAKEWLDDMERAEKGDKKK